MQVRMLRDKFGDNGTLYATGGTYTVSDDLGLRFIGEGAALDQDRPEFNPTVDLTPEGPSIRGLVSGDRNGGTQRVRTGPVRIATFGDSTANVGNLSNVGTATNHAADRVIVDAWNSGTKSLGLTLDRYALPCVYPMAYLVGIGGKSGEQTAAMLARDAASAATDRMAVWDILNLAPDVVLLRGGSINNLLTVTAGTVDATVATCVAEHIQILNRFLSAGVVVIDEGIYGFTNGTANTATSEAVTRQALMSVNAQIAAYIAGLNTNQARYIDWTGVVRDASGAWLPGMSIDGTHPSTLGQLAAAEKEAEVLRSLFGPSPGIRYPGANYVTNSLMHASSGGTATGYTLAGTNATVGSQAIEVIDGKNYQTGVWTLSSGSSNTCIINMPFNPSGTGTMNITSGDVWGFEFDLLLQAVSGTPTLSNAGLYGQARFVNTTGAGDVFINAIAASLGFAIPTTPIKMHVVIPPIRVDAASAALTTGSRFQAQVLLPAQTGQLKIGVAQPRIVKLGQSYLTV